MTAASDSVTVLAGRAYSLLEENGPSSIEDGSPKAERAKLHWDAARRAALAAVDWGFASRVARLAPRDDPGIVPQGWSRFAKPKEFLSLFAARDDPNRLYDEGDDVAHHIEESDIVARIDNSGPAEGREPSPLYVRYAYDETRAGLFTAEFEEALVHYWAYLLAPQTHSSRSKTADMLNGFNALVGRGARKEAQQQEPPSYLPPVLQVRWIDVIDSGGAEATHLIAGGRL